MQVLCKAFALEFNGLLELETPIDFLVTACLQSKSEGGRAGPKPQEYMCLEPFVEGDFVKYNSNALYVKADSPADPFNRVAQAFSHFTFERSWGSFMVVDLQGVGNLLTDPAVHTRDEKRFVLSDTNLHVDGFKCFFAMHVCNSICHELGLRSNRDMAADDKYEFRKHWPTMKPTVCCSNKLCQRIIRLSSANKSDKFPGSLWCSECWPQLQKTTTTKPCDVGGVPRHEFELSLFFHTSQGQIPPRRCPEHRVKDTTASSSASVGGGLWNQLKLDSKLDSVAGNSW